jgi:Fe-S-cluster-containing dehydrogenase component
MSKWNLIIDIDKCNGCFNCFLSAKDEHIGNEFPGYAASQPLHGHQWIGIRVVERGAAPTLDLSYLPVTCNHCDNAPCVKAGGGAVNKRKDGIVIIDPEKARGRRDLVDACPYGAIWWNEEQQLPQAWIFDAHLLDQGWQQPRCVQACGTGAMQAVKVDDAQMQQLVREQQLEVLQPELGTQPRVYYRNLRAATAALVADTVTATVDGVCDVVKGAQVTLRNGTQSVGGAVTDAFGEFRIEVKGLSAGEYVLDIQAGGMRAASQSVQLTERGGQSGQIDLAAA